MENRFESELKAIVSSYYSLFCQVSGLGCHTETLCHLSDIALLHITI